MSNNLQLVIPKMLKSVGCGSKKKKKNRVNLPKNRHFVPSDIDSSLLKIF